MIKEIIILLVFSYFFDRYNQANEDLEYSKMGVGK